MSSFANTPKPPYYAVIFTSEHSGLDEESYSDMSDRMAELAKLQDGFLGMESARNELGLTVSYWRDIESIKKWKMNSEHLEAQNKGRTIWYKKYKTRICLVERDYEIKNE